MAYKTIIDPNFGVLFDQPESVKQADLKEGDILRIFVPSYEGLTIIPRDNEIAHLPTIPIVDAVVTYRKNGDVVASVVEGNQGYGEIVLPALDQAVKYTWEKIGEKL